MTLTSTISSFSYYSSLLSSFTLILNSLHTQLEDYLRSALSASYAQLSSQLYFPPELQLPNVIDSIQRQGSILSTQKTLFSICHKFRLASYLSSTSEIKYPFRFLACFFSCRTYSSQHPFTELPEPRSCTIMELEGRNMMVQLCLGKHLFEGTQPYRRCVLCRPDPPPLLYTLGVHVTGFPTLE